MAFPTGIIFFFFCSSFFLPFFGSPRPPTPAIARKRRMGTLVFVSVFLFFPFLRAVAVERSRLFRRLRDVHTQYTKAKAKAKDKDNTKDKKKLLIYNNLLFFLLSSSLFFFFLLFSPILVVR